MSLLHMDNEMSRTFAVIQIIFFHTMESISANRIQRQQIKKYNPQEDRYVIAQTRTRKMVIV